MSEKTNIPVVSVASIGANVTETNIETQDLRQIGETLVEAFTDIGFCYVTEHGVDQSLLDQCFRVSKDFFKLPIETKKLRLRGECTEDFFGWLPKPTTEGIDRKPETFDNSLPPDYKETYNLSSNLEDSRFPTDAEVTGFRAATLKIIQAMEVVSHRLLLALGYGLNLEDPRALLKTSSKLGTSDNNTMLRYAFYPRVPPEQMKENLLRCGIHSDFGHITLLVDNGVSGLQIMNRNGMFLEVPSHKGALVVNIADSLERITGGILRSAPHRVTITPENSEKNRYSIIYFRVPDNAAYLDPVCGEKEKYEEKITAIDFFTRRFNDIFVHGAGVVQNATSN